MDNVHGLYTFLRACQLFDLICIPPGYHIMGLLFFNKKPNWVLHQVKALGGLILVRLYPTCFTLHLMSRSKNVRPLTPHDLSMVTVVWCFSNG
jgi:hypothetical protein